MKNAGEKQSFRMRLVAASIDFIDHHPRIGWYLVVLSVLNVLLNALDLIK